MTPEWFYRHADQEPVGPLPLSRLQALAASGRLQGDALVRKQGMAKWTPVRQLKGLFPQIGPPPAATLDAPPADSGATTDLPPGPRPADAATLPPSGSHPAASSSGLPAIPGYEVLGELGRGGMGVVYKARQKGLNRLVALKMILSGAGASEEALARFRAEAEAVARLQHPNIVQIHEVGEFEGTPFFSLEFVNGGSLDRYLKGQPQPPRDAAALVATLADAMHAAHQAGIVHRDLKPANILLSAELGARSAERSEQAALEGSALRAPRSEFRAPKITDFGLAKTLDADSGRTQEGRVMGTPSYMAPEQAEGRPDRISPRTDVYTLGAILYELLTGRPPFKAATPLDTVLQVVEAEPVPPRQLLPKVPRDLETVCLKCLQKDPARRYASARSLAADLRRFLADEPITARPVGRLERGYRWCRRNPMVALLSAVLVVSVVGGLAGYAWQLWEIQRQYLRARRMSDAAIQTVDRLTQIGVERLGLATLGVSLERQQQLEEALELCKLYLDPEANDPVGRWENGRTYARMATLQMVLGRFAEAIGAAQKAAALQEARLQQAAISDEDRWEVAKTQLLLGHATLFGGGGAGGEAVYQRVLSLTEPLAERDPQNPKVAQLRAEACRHLGILTMSRRQWDAALKWHGQDHAIYTRLAEAAPNNAEYACMVAAGDINQGAVHLNAGRVAQAEEHLKRAMARFDRALDQAAAEQRVYEAVRAQGLLVYATVLGSQDREKEGKQMVEKAILGLGSLVPEYPKMADILAQLFGVMSVTAEKEDAAWLVGLTDRTIPFLEAAVRRAPRIDNVRICLCHALGVRALEGKLHLGRGEEALQDLDRAIALCDRPPMAHLGSLHRLNRAAVLATLGRREEALAAVRTELNAPDPLVQAGRTGRGDRLLVAGYVYAVAAEKAAGDLHLSEADRRAKADELATQAVAYLRDAHKAGFVFLGALATAERTRKNPAYALFKDRADFQTLLQEIGRGNPGR